MPPGGQKLSSFLLVAQASQPAAGYGFPALADRLFLTGAEKPVAHPFIVRPQGFGCRLQDSDSIALPPQSCVGIRQQQTKLGILLYHYVPLLQLVHQVTNKQSMYHNL